MALSCVSTVIFFPMATPSHNLSPFPLSTSSSCLSRNIKPLKTKWRSNVSFFPSFIKKDANLIKQELLEAIDPLDRGAEATSEDQQKVDQITRKLEAVNPTKAPLKSDLLNGKWELIYTTSVSILQTTGIVGTPIGLAIVIVHVNFRHERDTIIKGG